MSLLKCRWYGHAGVFWLSLLEFNLFQINNTLSNAEAKLICDDDKIKEKIKLIPGTHWACERRGPAGVQ